MEPGVDEASAYRRPVPLSLLAVVSEEALVAQVTQILGDVGAVVSLLTLWEHLRARVSAETGAALPALSKNAVNADVSALAALLHSWRATFILRKAPWSPHARVVSLARGAAPQRSHRASRDAAAEEAYAARLVEYVRS